ncbi:cation diffusion facilitator family transporter [Jongsikchunia kroppenstedtii]|uniref:cation diffusion facilitator family transporter n=1 Tax=Jongsikchunia kroppenstedtii TaxID=1121721 RepID=UPI0004760A8E|nr:cation diffusion facilitator family transporter [Jongsikchunia kroppenstedtii]
MGHSHSHGHSHTGASGANRRLWPMVLGALIISSFFVVELVVALLVNSLALLADAGHMLTDVVALLMGLGALLLARHGAADGGKAGVKTFGWHRAEVMTAVVNAALLFGVAGYVLYEAIQRIGTDPDTPGLPLVIVAIIGLAANLVVMLLLRGDAQESIAVRGAYMEVLADAVGSVGVLIAGIVTLTTGWRYADLTVAVLVALWVVPRAGRLALDALRILVQQAPAHIDVAGLRDQLTALDVVDEVHDLHVWTLTTGMDVATVHVTSRADNATVLVAAQRVLDAHGLHHATIQVDTPEMRDQCHEELTW